MKRGVGEHSNSQRQDLLEALPLCVGEVDLLRDVDAVERLEVASISNLRDQLPLPLLPLYQEKFGTQ